MGLKLNLHLGQRSKASDRDGESSLMILAQHRLAIAALASAAVFMPPDSTAMMVQG